MTPPAGVSRQSAPACRLDGEPVTVIAVDYGGYAVTSWVPLVPLRMACCSLCRLIPPSRNRGSHGPDGDERLTVASASFSGTGADSGEDWRQALAGLLHAESARAVLCRQMPGEEPDDIHRDLQSVREAGMTAVVVRHAFHPDPADGPGRHGAILVRGSGGPDIVSAGQADVPWSEALLTAPGIPCAVGFYSTWLPDGSKTRRRRYATLLSTRVTALERGGGQPAFADGNWSCLAPADNYTQPQLRRMPERPHLAAIDMWWDDTLEPVLNVHHVLEGAGRARVTIVRPRHRYPPELGPTRRACRAYVNPGSRQGRRQLPAGPQQRGRRPARTGHRSRAARLSLQGARR